MEDVRIIANIGVVKGGANGDGLLYAGKTSGGTYMGIVYHLEDVEGTPTAVPRYYRKSVIENYMATQDILLASDFNLALLTDQAAPTFVDEEDESFWPQIETIVNGSTATRSFTGQSPYTVKGEGVTTADVEALKKPGSTTGSTIGSSTTGTVTAAAGSALTFIPPSADFGLLFSNPLEFIQKYPLFVGIVLAVIYWTRRKKKKPLWIF